MARVVGIDHLSIRVSDYEKSKAFYGRLFAFLGFEVEAEYPGTMGWKNGHTLFWIGQAEFRRPQEIPRRRRRDSSLRFPAAEPERCG